VREKGFKKICRVFGREKRDQIYASYVIGGSHKKERRQLHQISRNGKDRDLTQQSFFGGDKGQVKRMKQESGKKKTKSPALSRKEEKKTDQREGSKGE